MDPSSCKPQDVSLWHRYIAEKPFRVLDVFRIVPRGSNGHNKWGDTRKVCLILKKGTYILIELVH